MSILSLHIKKNRLLFASGFIGLIIIQVQVFRNLGFSWKIALWDSAVANMLLALACALISNALHYYLPQKNKYTVLFAWSLGLAGIWYSLIQILLPAILEQEKEYLFFFHRSILIRFWIAVLIINWTAMMNVLQYKQQQDKQNEKRKNDAERLAKEAELYNLRQQLQPHFLFNSLNSINALIGSQPQQARKMIHQLSDFLRGTLKKEEQQWVNLDEELQHLQLYLEIEKVRFGHRLNTDIIREETGEYFLPPMLLQPIVENAIKFGLYDRTDDITIHIKVNEEQQHLLISVENPFDPETSSPSVGMGFGLSSVQRRLYLLFARNDLLTTKADNNLFTTTVKIPQHDKGNNHR